MNKRSNWIGLIALAAILPLAACGVDEEGDLEMEDEGMMEEPAPAPTTGGDMMEPMTVTLEPKNDSGVTGEATARHQGESVTIDVNVSGVAEDGELPAHVHTGTCDSPGQVVAPLTSLQVTGGSGMSTSTLTASQLSENEEAIIQVHDTGGQPIACADLRGHGGMSGSGQMGEMGDTTGM